MLPLLLVVQALAFAAMPVPRSVPVQPLAFEANRGQTDGRVKFLSRGPGYALYLTPTSTVITLSKPTDDTKRSSRTARFEQPTETVTAAVRCTLSGANTSAEVEGEAPQPGLVNVYRGSDPTKWRTGIGTYGKVRVGGVYPGIDLVYYGNENRLEHDFVVAPGADPARIRWRITGAKSLSVSTDGDLVMQTAVGQVAWKKPVAYQEAGGARRRVVSAFRVRGNSVTFALGVFDRSRPLVIDPVLAYSTFLGGAGESSSSDVAVDKDGNVWIAGFSSDAEFPTTPSAYQTAKQGDSDAVLLKFDRDGRLLYSTFFGGTKSDAAAAITIDPSGDVWIGGGTASSDLPTTPGAHDRTLNGGGDCMVAKFHADGTLTYSTYLGSLGQNFINPGAIAADKNGNVWVASVIGIPYDGFPITPNAIRTFDNLGDETNRNESALTKFSPSGTLLYSTFLGGNQAEQAFGLTTDTDGDVWVTGFTQSSDFPVTPDAYLHPIIDIYKGAIWAFITALTPSGSLLYSTYFGDGHEQGSGIAVDRSGGIWIAGSGMPGQDFPTTPDAFIVPNEGSSIFLSRLSRTDGLTYSALFGGAAADYVSDLAIDASGNLWLAGWTQSADFPTTPDAFQTSLLAATAFILTEFDKSGKFLYGTYLGVTKGQSDDPLWNSAQIAPAPSGSLWLTGSTISVNFPTSPDAFDPTHAPAGSTGGVPANGVLIRFDPGTPIPPVASLPAGTASGPVCMDGVAYLGADDGKLYAYHTADGTVVSGFPVDLNTALGATVKILTRPTVYATSSGTAVYATTNLGHLVKVGTNGSVLWHVQPLSGATSAGTPAVTEDGAVYVGVSDTTGSVLYRLDGADGHTLKASNRLPMSSLGAPSVPNGSVVLPTADGFLLLDAVDLTVRAAFASGESALAPYAQGQHAYVGTTAGRLYKVNVSTGNQDIGFGNFGRSELGHPTATEPFLGPQKLFVGTADGKVMQVDPNTGAASLFFEAGGTEVGGVTLNGARNALAFGNAAGWLVSLPLDGIAPTEALTLGGAFSTPPSFDRSTGRFLVADETGRLFRLPVRD